MVNIKVIHKEAVRRFTLPSNATWIELEAKLRTLFSIPAFSPFTLSYTDEDNDIITLSTDSELQEILFSAPTVKFNLKFSTSDDSSDSEDSSNEVWVLEGGNILPHRRTASITKIETDTPGFQDNVSQKNIVSSTNQEPQFIEIDSRDIIEPSSIPVNDDLEEADELKVEEKIHQAEERTRQVNLLDDDLEKADEKALKVEEKIHQAEERQVNLLDDLEKADDEVHEVEEKIHQVGTHQVNLLDDVFFETFNNSLKLSTYIHETSIEDKQETIEASSSNNAFTHTSLKQDQSQQLRQDSVIDLQQFQMMIEQNQDAIKENSRLVASIKDVMDQIRQLDSFRQPITMSRKRNNNFFNRPITPPIPGYTTHSLSVPPTPEFCRATTPPPIPGTFPKHPARVVSWASQPPRNRSRGRRGRHHRHQYNKRNHNDINHDDNHGQGEKILDDKEETEEASESQETTDLRILHGVYGEEIDLLTNMGFRDENALVELLMKHDGDVAQVIEELFKE